MTTTFLPLQASSGYFPAFTSRIMSKMVDTLPAAMFSFRPGMGGTRGTEPVALTTTSGLKVLILSRVASVFKNRYRLGSLAARRSR